MSKVVTFTDKDESLIRRIKNYQKEKKLSSFVEAVRQLCDTALQMKGIANKLK